MYCVESLGAIHDLTPSDNITLYSVKTTLSKLPTLSYANHPKLLITTLAPSTTKKDLEKLELWNPSTGDLNITLKDSTMIPIILQQIVVASKEELLDKAPRLHSYN